MTDYSEIYELALQMIDDPLMAQWSDSDLSATLHNWLIQSIYYFPKFSDILSDRDDEVESFNNTLPDILKLGLALQMKRCWLSPQISSITLTLQRSSKKESYSQAEHLKELKALDDNIMVELRKMMRDNTYINNEYFNN